MPLSNISMERSRMKDKNQKSFEELRKIETIAERHQCCRGNQDKAAAGSNHIDLSVDECET